MIFDQQIFLLSLIMLDGLLSVQSFSTFMEIV